MSRIYFHSPSGDAEVSGAERAHFGVTCGDIAVALLRVSSFDPDPIVSLLPADIYLKKYEGHTFQQSFNTWMTVGDSYFVLPDGRRFSTFEAILNTVLTFGDDVLRFMARIHGQCEVWAYVEGPNRDWLAGLIDLGLTQNLLRDKLRGHSLGWRSVIELLRKSNSEPVVTSYSVCDSFPNPTIAGWRPPPTGTDDDEDGDWDAWYELPEEERWSQALKGLRREEARLLEMRPDNWKEVRFGLGLTVMDLRRIAEEKAREPV